MEHLKFGVKWVTQELADYLINLGYTGFTALVECL